jgi:hypothetical protein
MVRPGFRVRPSGWRPLAGTAAANRFRQTGGKTSSPVKRFGSRFLREPAKQPTNRGWNCELTRSTVNRLEASGLESNICIRETSE